MTWELLKQSLTNGSVQGVVRKTECEDMWVSERSGLLQGASQAWRVWKAGAQQGRVGAGVKGEGGHRWLTAINLDFILHVCVGGGMGEANSEKVFEQGELITLSM